MIAVVATFLIDRAWLTVLSTRSTLTDAFVTPGQLRTTHAGAAKIFLALLFFGIRLAVFSTGVADPSCRAFLVFGAGFGCDTTLLCFITALCFCVGAIIIPKTRYPSTGTSFRITLSCGPTFIVGAALFGKGATEALDANVVFETIVVCFTLCFDGLLLLKVFRLWKISRVASFLF